MANSLKEMAAGAISGASQILIGHPFDTVKVKIQSEALSKTQGGGVIDAMKKIIESEGGKGFYRGMAAPLATVALLNSIVFTTRGQMEKFLSYHDPAAKHNSIIKQAICGAGAGLAVSFAVCPIELIKCRLQVNSSSIGATDMVKYAMKAEGRILGLYRGFAPTLVREVIGNGVMFGSYEALKQVLAGGSDTSNLRKGQMMVAGGASGAFVWVVVYPSDVVKSMIQVDDYKQPKYEGTFDAFRKLYEARKLYRGFGAAILRSVPANAACFLAYESAKSWLG